MTGICSPLLRVDIISFTSHAFEIQEMLQKGANSNVISRNDFIHFESPVFFPLIHLHLQFLQPHNYILPKLVGCLQ